MKTKLRTEHSLSLKLAVAEAKLAESQLALAKATLDRVGRDIAALYGGPGARLKSFDSASDTVDVVPAPPPAEEAP